MGIVTRKTTSLLALIALFSTQAPAQTTPRTQPASTLPAQLSNAEFWRIINEFSEPGGSFPSDNFTSNELQIGQVTTELIERGRTGGAYLGVGPEQNFTYITAVKPQIVFIVDIRRQAVMQHLMYKAVFEMSANRSEFISRLFSKPLQTVTDTSIRSIWQAYIGVPADTALYRTNAEAIHNHLTKTRGFAISPEDSMTIANVYSVFYRFGPAISYNARVGAFPSPNQQTTGATFLSLTAITDTMGVPRSFLASEANFNILKSLHTKNLFIPVVGNFGGPMAMRKVGDYLREHRTFLNAHYVSNVEQYLFRPPTGGSPAVFNEYYTTVGFMPLDSLSVFIRTNAARVNNAQVMGLVQGMQLVPAGQTGFSYTVVRAMAPAPPVPPVPPVTVAQDPALGYITGVVSDSASGRPLASAMVQILGTATSVVSDQAGQYLIPNVTPGIITLRTSRVGYAPTTAADVRVVAGGPTVVDLKPPAQALILTGVVTTGNYTVVTSGSAMSGQPGTTLCPMMEFLAAYKAGRVLSYNDANRCVR